MARIKVLIIDDDKLMHKIYGRIFNKEHFEITPSFTGKDGLSKLKTETFEIIIIDILLGDKIGTDILKDIEKNKSSVKVMVSGTDDVDNVIHSVNYGADLYFKKPFNANEFLSALKKKYKEKRTPVHIDNEKISKWIEDRFKDLYEENE